MSLLVPRAPHGAGRHRPASVRARAGACGVAILSVPMIVGVGLPVVRTAVELSPVGAAAPIGVSPADANQSASPDAPATSMPPVTAPVARPDPTASGLPEMPLPAPPSTGATVPPIADDQPWAAADIEAAPVLERNDGQFAAEVDFVVRGSDATVFLADGHLVYDTRDAASGHVVRMAVTSTNPALVPTAAEPVSDASATTTPSATTNYFLGADPASWVTDVVTASTVEYDDVAPGVDLRYLGTAEGLRYDLMLAAGVDPTTVRLAFDGSQSVTVDETGALVVGVSVGDDMVFSPPLTYQDTAAGRVEVPSAYDLQPDGSVGFAVGAFDTSYPLVIDPTLAYSSYLGGSGSDAGTSIAVDSTGAVVVAGWATSSDFPTTVGAYDAAVDGAHDIVVSRFSAAGSLVWSTYLGGSASDSPNDIALDASNDIYIAALTDSSNFPVTAGAFSTTRQGTADGAVIKLASSGSSLSYSTYLGSSAANDNLLGIAVDTSNQAVVVGSTNGSSYPTTVGAYDTTFNSGSDVVVTKLNATGTGLVWSTLYGDTGADVAEEVVLDASNVVYVTGSVSSGSVTTAGSYDTSLNGSTDLWVAKFAAAGNALAYSTVVGSTGAETGMAIAISSPTTIFVAGQSASASFPTVAGAHDTSHNGSEDVVALRLDLSLSGSAQLTSSTFLGGTGIDRATGIALDSFGRAHVSMFTVSSGLATLHAPDTTLTGTNDGALAIFTPNSGALAYLTYVGGSGTESVNGVALTPSREIWTTGSTTSTDFTTAGSPYDTTLGGTTDVYVARYTALAAPNVVTVNSTGDGADGSAGNGVCSTSTLGECTLRAAIQEANASSTVDTIQFNIPTTDGNYVASPVAFTIRPGSVLPTLTTAMTIDGWSQPQYATAGRPVIEIDGTNATAGEQNGIWITSTGNTIRGLVINRFLDDGIDIEATGSATVVGNYVGTDVTGSIARANAWGVNLKGSGSVVGGTSAAERNVVSGNSTDGFYIYTSTSTGNVVQGNYIGLNAAGTGALGNGRRGVYIHTSASGNTIGGTTVGARNVISANAISGVYISDSGTNANLVRGNWIGTNASGGGTTFGNGGWGVYVLNGAANNQIGGTAGGAGNVVTNNAQGGVAVANSSTGNRVARNLVYANTGVEIDLGANGTATNDGAKTSGQPNLLMDHPVITSAVLNGSTLTVSGYVGSAAAQSTFASSRVEVFKADTEASNRGGAIADLGSFDTVSTGSFVTPITVTGLAVGDEITATATDTAGNTSEFGANPVVVSNVVVVNSTLDGADASIGNGICQTATVGQCTLRAAIQEANATAIDTIRFSIPAALVNSTHLIAPALLPTISSPVTIDATTEPDFTGTPIVTLSGENAGFNDNGLTLDQNADGSRVRGLVIRDWGGDGVEVLADNDGSTIAGNYIGRINVSGTDSGAGTQNGWEGVTVSGTNATIGGPSLADRNVLSGNGETGVYIYTEAADGTRVQNNIIGVTAAGSALLANDVDAIIIDGGGDNTIIEDNLIAHPNGDGIEITGASSGTVIQGNTIGTNVARTMTWSGRFAGISIENGASNSLIGGTATGDGNVIANAGSNSGNPNSISIWSTAGSGISILGNTIYGSRGRGIDLNPIGLTSNDTGDGDTGPNDLLNFPVITSAGVTGGTVDVTFNLDTPANAAGYRVEFFRNPGGANPVGVWEAEQFVSAVTVQPGTGRTHSFSGSVGDVITATATRIDGSTSSGYSSTSEVSAQVTAVSSVVVVNSTGDGADAAAGNGVCSTGGTNSAGQAACTLRAAIQEANASAAINTIRFNMPTTESGHSAGVWTIAPPTALPTITGAATIDGTTQSGVTVNTAVAPAAMNGTLAVRVSGASLPSGTSGITLAAGSSGSVVRGLALTDFVGGSAYAIVVTGSSNNVIAGNHIGVTPAGTTAAANRAGVFVTGASSGNRIGGTAAADRNVIAASSYAQIAITGSGVTATSIQGNEIGLLNGGLLASAGTYGIVAWDGATGIRVGGTSANAGNRIAGQTTAVLFDSNAAASQGWLLGNLIWGSQRIGIDLDNDGGVTANDANDADSGPNTLLNYPVITTATAAAGTTTVNYTLDVPAGNYRVEFFTNPSGAHTSGHGEAQTFVHAASITHVGGGSRSFSTSFAGAVGDIVTATATTDLGGGTYGVTSELSGAKVVSPPTLDPVVYEGIQKGLTVLPAGSSSVTVAIDPVVTSRSFLVFTLRGGDSSPDNFPVTGELTNATTLTFDRYGTVGTIAIDWSVVEFASGVTVQRGSTTLNGATATTNVSIAAVDTARSFALVNQRLNGTTFGANDFVRASLTTSNLALTKVDAAGSNVVKWQVITYNDAVVQAGTVALGSAAASTTATIAATDLNQAWLVYTASSAQGTDADIGQKLVRGSVTNATTLTFDRSRTGQAMTVSYFLVEFTDATTVQRGSAAFGTSTTSVTSTISTVDPARTISVGGSMQHGGRSAYAADDNPGVGTFTTRVVAPTSLLTDRAITGSATADLGWSVVHWPGVARTTVTVNSTDDDPDTFPGDGFCDTYQQNDTGGVECTLRAAIQEANANPNVATIAFAIPNADSGRVVGAPTFWRIAVQSALPSVDTTIAIDARTQPGSGAPRVVLDGAALTGNHDGFRIVPPGHNSTVRGFSIVDFPDDGIDVTANGVTITDNYVGVTPDGVTGVGNGTEGIIAWGASDVTIASNLIGGHPNAAIATGATMSGAVITGNLIGTDASGTVDLGNGQGLWSDVNGTLRFGGVGPGDGNVVANTTYAGVEIRNAGSQVTVLGNQIGNSGALGIDLVGGIDIGDGVTANDPGDSDTGPNDLLNLPVITDAVDEGGFAVLTVDTDVPAGDYRVEVFSNPSGSDPSGYGEAESLIGATTLDHSGGGSQRFRIVVPAVAGDVITATLTEDLGGGAFGATSELSRAVVVDGYGGTVVDHGVRRTDLRARNGADVGATVAGAAAAGIELGGSGQRLVGPATDVTSSALTLSGWVRLDTPGTAPRLVSKSVGSGGVAYELSIDDATGEAIATMRIGGAPVEVRGGTIGSGTWHQLAATWDGANVRLYVDGAEVDAAPATGALATDITTSLVVGNRDDGDRGVDGRIDHVQITHTARSAAWIATEHANVTDPGAFVTLGAAQTAAPGDWTTSSTTTRSGSHALAAPNTNGGGDAWATVRGLDEPGLSFEAWWYLTGTAGNEVAAGTNTGRVPTDQREAGAVGGAVDLATSYGGARVVEQTSAATVGGGAWTHVEIRTDESGRSSVRVGGVQVIAPTLHGGGSSGGSAGLRVGALATDQWYVDDVRIRRYVSTEPTTTLGPLNRN